ncbi:MAG: nucleotidyl transferase AbiEii/AbiGii toxin family protein [Lentimicrobiaceae bacterium]|nr:nucleotidyl transferase AbiEii/AbiGii toxin family protein [Lentimicrobiaceae bacterium]
MNNNKHRFYLTQILTDIYSDRELARCLGFKGGTALMFFHDLPRFSVDLDFDLLETEKAEQVYAKVKNILLKYGEIHDEAQKFFGDLLALNYEYGERNLKIDISHRKYNNEYEIKNLLGISVKTMKISDMFSHKLVALLGRKEIADRDIFDCWWFMNRQTPVKIAMIENLTQKNYSDYMQECITAMENLPKRSLLYGLGELLEQDMKTFVRNKLRTEIVTLFRFYKDFPII